MQQFKSEGCLLAEFPHWFPEMQSVGYDGRKGQQETTRTVTTQKNSKPKQCYIPGGIAEISATMKDLKDRCTGGDSHHFPIQLAYLVCTEDRSWSLTVDCHKFNQVVTPIATV